MPCVAVTVNPLVRKALKNENTRLSGILRQLGITRKKGDIVIDIDNEKCKNLGINVESPSETNWENVSTKLSVLIRQEIETAEAHLRDTPISIKTDLGNSSAGNTLQMQLIFAMMKVISSAEFTQCKFAIGRNFTMNEIDGVSVQLPMDFIEGFLIPLLRLLGWGLDIDTISNSATLGRLERSSLSEIQDFLDQALVNAQGYQEKSYIVDNSLLPLMISLTKEETAHFSRLNREVFEDDHVGCLLGPFAEAFRLGQNLSVQEDSISVTGLDLGTLAVTIGDMSFFDMTDCGGQIFRISLAAVAALADPAQSVLFKNVRGNRGAKGGVNKACSVCIKTLDLESTTGSKDAAASGWSGHLSGSGSKSYNIK